jgi:signal transduction histidine kinase
VVSAPTFESLASRYTAALLVSGAVVVLRLLLIPFLGDHLPYATLFAAVALAAWFCGTGPAVSATIVGLLAARYWFVHPTHTFSIPDTPQSVGILTFLSTSGIIIALGEVSRRNREKLRIAHEQLEAQIHQRTTELEAANKNLRDLTGHVLHLQDEERRRIARELHDSAGQSLAALSMNLTRVKADLDRLASAATTVTDSLELVREMSTDIRTISYLLHPPLLDEAGLEPALRWYINGFSERSKIAVDLDMPEDFGRLPSDVETAIFRIVQESLANILRHSQSPIARVRVSRSDREVRVEVRDKGKGVSPEKLAEMASAGTPGVGIRGMHERVRQLGGTLEMNSDGAGKGAIVVARLPAASRAVAAVASAGT